MTVSRDPNRLIHAFLREGLDELPNPVYDAVRDRIEETRQRVVIGPWRTPGVNRYLKLVLVAAAAVVIAIVGYQFLGNSNTGGPGATETPRPTSTLTATTQPTATPPAGTSHVLLDGPPQINVVLSAPGWSGDAGGGILEKGPLGGDPPDGAGMITFTGPLYVYGDPCHWQSTRPATPATTAEELAAALAAQPSRDASDPADILVGGYAGKSITLHVPVDLAFSAGAHEFTDCDEGNFASFGSDSEPGPARHSQGPGQIDELYIFEVGGVLVTIDTAYFAGTPPNVVDELRAIIRSATPQLP